MAGGPRQDLPMDTLLDRDERLAANPDALVVMKAIYLSWPPIATLRNVEGWTDTELIDTLERLRRDGMIVVQTDGKGFRIDLTPTGSVAGFLQALRRTE